MADYEIETNPDTGAPLISRAGHLHGLGCKVKASSPFADRYPPVSAVMPPIPSAQWVEIDERKFCVPVLDQGRSSACGPHALAEVMGAGFAMTSDEQPILSAWWAYGQCNGGRDEGTSLPDLLRLAETKGVPPDSLVKHGNMFGPYPAEADKQAGRFKIEAAYNAPALSDLASAMQRPGHFGLIGIDVGSQFEPDGEGFLPPFRPDPTGVLGHAISTVGLKYARGMWWPLIQNHWTKQWGMKGFAYLHPSYWNPAFGSWVLKTLRPDPNDTTPPPSV
jgi:hypothetical protein